MCDPITISLIAATTLAAGSTAYAGVSGAAAKNYEKRVAEANAASEANAAAVEESRFRRNMKDQQGELLAAQGASGYLLNSVSPLVAFAEQAGELEQDALLIRAGGAERRAGHLNNAALAKMSANQALIGGFLGAGADVLTGVTQYASLQGAASGGEG